jgi:hypothetical protein
VLNIFKGKKDRITNDELNLSSRGDTGHVIFALPWFITWYSHVLDNLDIILRLYDLFIVSHYLMPIYVAAEVRYYLHFQKKFFFF